MNRILFEGIVQTDYGQLDLVWTDGGGFDGEVDRFFAGQVNGLVGAAAPGTVYVNLARRSGGSHVRIVLTPDEPPVPEDEYDDVVEVSTSIPEGADPRWESWAAESSRALSGLVPGTYRLRVSARGRDAGSEQEFAETVVDEYLLELWPAEPAPDSILRVGSSNAAYWHEEWGGRR